MFPLADCGLPLTIWTAEQKFAYIFKMISKIPLKVLLKNGRTTEAFGHRGMCTTCHMFSENTDAALAIVSLLICPNKQMVPVNINGFWKKHTPRTVIESQGRSQEKERGMEK